MESTEVRFVLVLSRLRADWFEEMEESQVDGRKGWDCCGGPGTGGTSKSKIGLSDRRRGAPGLGSGGDTGPPNMEVSVPNMLDSEGSLSRSSSSIGSPRAVEFEVVIEAAGRVRSTAGK